MLESPPIKPLAWPHDAPLPRHVGMIMDGNRRWARMRGIGLARGYRRGLATLRTAVRAAVAWDIPFLTVYAFSNANWQRPPAQVKLLMDLVRTYVRGDLAELHRNGVRLQVPGRREGLATDIVRMIEEAIDLTADNKGMTLSLALNYGGRDEIMRAAMAYAKAGGKGEFAGYLDSGQLPPIDLLIRTGGEQRLSDFLLWQSAYAELMFLEQLWPDFSTEDFAAALKEYARRERRFGADGAEIRIGRRYGAHAR